MTDTTERDPAALEPEDAISSQLEALHTRLAEAETVAAGARDQQLRAAAELDNVRKRADREIDNARRYGAERVLGDLLAIADSLELGLKAAEAPEASAKSIGEGMALTSRQLVMMLEKFGVVAVDPVGQPFNPDFHEAVTAVPSADLPANHVISVMQKGYKLHDRLLRPAMVMVARPLPT